MYCRLALTLIRSRAPFALAVLLTDLALYNLFELVFFLRAGHFPDFLLFWAAARAVITHGPAAVYSATAFDAAVRGAWGSGPPWPYLNPPVLAWLLVPLALLPFGIAFGLWIIASASALLGAAWLFGKSWRHVLSAAAFLPAFLAIGSGQVGPLVLLALVLALGFDQRGRWAAAGGLLAILAIKPQLGVLLPVALLAAGRWRPLAVAGAIAAAVAGLVLASLGLEGVRTWLSSITAFSDNPYFLRWSLVPLTGDSGWWLALLAAAAAVAAAARRWRGDLGVVYGVWLVGTILVNHYLTPSDLVVLLLPVWALVRQGTRGAVLGGLLWSGGWLALFFPPVLVGAELVVLGATALPVVATAAVERLNPAPAS